MTKSNTLLCLIVGGGRIEQGGREGWWGANKMYQGKNYQDFIK